MCGGGGNKPPHLNNVEYSERQQWKTGVRIEKEKDKEGEVRLLSQPLTTFLAKRQEKHKAIRRGGGREPQGPRLGMEKDGYKVRKETRWNWLFSDSYHSILFLTIFFFFFN